MFDFSIDFSLYWREFLTIAIAHFVAVASPGPDFAIILKHGVQHGRLSAYATSVGIGTGIGLHMAYTLVGVSLVITQTPWLFTTLSTIAAIYIGYLGWQGLRSKPQSIQAQQSLSSIPISAVKAFSIGFLTNGLNPKATLFFLSLFTIIVSTSTPVTVQLFYGIYLMLATTLWFILLSYLISTKAIREFLLTQGFWFDRLMGIVLWLLAAKLLLDLL